MTDQLILSIDQGTTSSRAALFDRAGALVALRQREFPQRFSRPGWVEQDAGDILGSVAAVVTELLRDTGITPSRIAAIGIANQRETTIVWDRASGKPVHQAIVWQSRQSADICERLGEQAALVVERTGLVIDPYFCGSKIRWILEHVDGAIARARRGELLFGTVDSWLAWHMTGGREHITDVTNASRTLLFDIRSRTWDDELLQVFDVPRAMLPEVRASSGMLGTTSGCAFLPDGIPIAGIAGDQQAAMFGHACFEPGMVKGTYGTGCFVLMNTGTTPVISTHGMLTTIAWDVGGQVAYALEGSVFIAGAAVQWLRDGLGIIGSAAETERIASSISSTEGVYMVPAFVGTSAPYWNRETRGTILGLSRGSSRAHIVRAALESIAFQALDVVLAMQADAGIPVRELRADGGAIANDFLAQFQSDVLGTPLYRPRVLETTALGAAYLAGLGCGFWSGMDELVAQRNCERAFYPAVGADTRTMLYGGWRHALQAAMAFRADAVPA